MICVPFQPSLEPRSIHLAFTPVDKHPLPPKEPSPAHFAQPTTVQNTHYHLTLHTQLGTLNSNSAHFLHCLTLCNLFNCANFPPSPPSWLADDTNQLLVHSPVESLQSSLQKIFLTASASSPVLPFALPSGWHWISKPTVGQSEHGCWPLLLLLWSSPRWDPDCWCFWNGGMIAMVEGHWFSSTRVWHTERDSTCQSVVVWWRMIGFLHPEPSPPPPVANCVTSTQWCVTSTSGLIIAPVNAATLLPLLLDSIESPPSTDCPTSGLARNHQIVCPSDRCLPPWHCQPHPSSYFAEIFQPSTFGMAPLPKTYHSCHSPMSDWLAF